MKRFRSPELLQFLLEYFTKITALHRPQIKLTSNSSSSSFVHKRLKNNERTLKSNLLDSPALPHELLYFSLIAVIVTEEILDVIIVIVKHATPIYKLLGNA